MNKTIQNIILCKYMNLLPASTYKFVMNKIDTKCNNYINLSVARSGGDKFTSPLIVRRM